MEVTGHRTAVTDRAAAYGDGAVRCVYAVPGWGVGEIDVRDGALVAHRLPSRQHQASLRDGGPQGGSSTPEVTVASKQTQECDDFVSELCRRFAMHLAGNEVAYDDIRVDDEGLSPFQRDLLHAARSVGWGEVVTYGGLAALAGRSRAARAAGSFCATNRLSLVVPCHRVVAAGRDEPFSLGGYGPGGERLKRRLLALEGTLL
jgi:O-6-methylguanine DNA methyltransferase